MDEPLALLEHLAKETREEIETVLRKALAEIRAEGRRRVYAVVNQKGGAGKTTSALTLAAVWASWGLRVRLIDGDPQTGSATYWLPPQYPDGDPRYTLRDVYLGNCSLDEATYPTTVPGLFIVPSDGTLDEVERAHIAGSDLAMKAALADTKLDIDIEIFDTRPTLGTLTVSAMAASHELLITLGASGMDLPGLMDLGRTRALVKTRLNPEMNVLSVVITRDGETMLSSDVRKQLKIDYPDALHARIPASVRVQEAPLDRKPLTTFAPNNPATVAYVELAARVLVPKQREVTA